MEIKDIKDINDDYEIINYEPVVESVEESVETQVVESVETQVVESVVESVETQVEESVVESVETQVETVDITTNSVEPKVFNENEIDKSKLLDIPWSFFISKKFSYIKQCHELNVEDYVKDDLLSLADIIFCSKKYICHEINDRYGKSIEYELCLSLHNVKWYIHNYYIGYNVTFQKWIIVNTV